jgi:hypothetical protein
MVHPAHHSHLRLQPTSYFTISDRAENSSFFRSLLDRR